MNDQLPLSFEQRKILSVTQLTRAVKGTLEREWPVLWVRGEIGNWRAVSGHHYFNLKDESACIKVVLFRNEAMRLKFKIGDGQQVLAPGRLTVFEPKGAYP